MPTPASDLRAELTRLHTQLTTVRGVTLHWSDFTGRAAAATLRNRLEAQISNVEGLIRDSAKGE